MSADWRNHAACAGMDLACFFPPGDNTITKEAKEACAVCPVTAECLEYALDAPEKWGTWASTTPKDREVVRRRRLRAARKNGDEGEAA